MIRNIKATLKTLPLKTILLSGLVLSLMADSSSGSSSYSGNSSSSNSSGNSSVDQKQAQVAQKIHSKTMSARFKKAQPYDIDLNHLFLRFKSHILMCIEDKIINENNKTIFSLSDQKASNSNKIIYIKTFQNSLYVADDAGNLIILSLNSDLDIIEKVAIKTDGIVSNIHIIKEKSKKYLLVNYTNGNIDCYLLQSKQKAAVKIWQNKTSLPFGYYRLSCSHILNNSINTYVVFKPNTLTLIDHRTGAPLKDIPFAYNNYASLYSYNNHTIAISDRTVLILDPDGKIVFSSPNIVNNPIGNTNSNGDLKSKFIYLQMYQGIYQLDILSRKITKIMDLDEYSSVVKMLGNNIFINTESKSFILNPKNNKSISITKNYFSSGNINAILHTKDKLYIWSAKEYMSTLSEYILHS